MAQRRPWCFCESRQDTQTILVSIYTFDDNHLKYSLDMRLYQEGMKRLKIITLIEQEALKEPPGMVAYDYNPIPWKAEARGSLVNSRPC